ncbi:hypothetical protein G5714_006861 [Onychostoma macrolepis]|uniref:Uncharacterized protein n=1 Tax=Onychostoma macrolepis TaxID=369639 RepID=A0A7J6CXJ5_9TELE|nr:hypothetical protein G5714_006861 [Onychostoma macrolepis]
MTVAIGTDFWLYSRAHICNTTNATDETHTFQQPKKTRGDLTHSGLWRICCIEGINNGSCYWINHFSVDNDYDTDSSEYLLRLVRASSLFPILSTILLLLGGFCVGLGQIYSSRNNILLSAGSYLYLQVIGVLAVNIYIEKNKEAHFKHFEFIKTVPSPSSSPYTSIPNYHYRQQRSQSCSQSREPSKNTSLPTLSVTGSSLPLGDILMYTVGREHPLKAGALASYNTDLEHPNFLQFHNRVSKDVKESLNHRITPV